MKQSQLMPYAPLYRAARYYGADTILLNWLGWEDLVLPMLLPHGVEIPGQYIEAADVRGMEPIYWAINSELFERASRIKPAILIPHPFVLSPAFVRRGARTGSETLIIGAPPGCTNDKNMLQALRDHGIVDGTMLVKRRSGWEASADFWHDNGYRTTTFGEPFDFSYDDMAQALAAYDHVVSTTASTAAFFAAACGAKVTLIKGCAFEAYELLSVTKIMQRQVPEASAWLTRFAAAESAEQNVLALKLLGHEHMDRERIQSELATAIGDLERPLYVESTYYPEFAAYLQAKLAIRLGKPRLASLRPANVWRALARAEVGIMTVKEIDYYIDGPSPESFVLDPVPYRRGITEPGVAVDPY